MINDINNNENSHLEGNSLIPVFAVYREIRIEKSLE